MSSKPLAEVAVGFTCLVGPPGSGVTAVCADLASRHHAVAGPSTRTGYGHTGGTAPAIAGASAASSHDNDGGEILSAALAYVPLVSGVGSVAVLPRSPANAAQLSVLRVATREVGLPLSVIELDTPDLVLAARMYGRRSCQTCGDTGNGDACEPRCGDAPCRHCGERDADWRPNEIRAFLATLHRYRLRQPGLWDRASQLGVPWVRLESCADRGALVSSVHNVLDAVAVGGLLAPAEQRQLAGRLATHDAMSSLTAPAARSGDTPPAPTRPRARASPTRSGLLRPPTTSRSVSDR